MTDINGEIDAMVESIHMEILALSKLADAVQEKIAAVAQSVLELEEKLTS